MKIVHIAPASHYTESMMYQDNALPDCNRADGHDVMIISDCSAYENGVLVSVPSCDTILPNGIRLIRLPYDRVLCTFVSEKLRKFKALYGILEEYAPDIIYLHGLQTAVLGELARYKRTHPSVKLYADSHSDFHNSARDFISRNILHRLIYRPMIRRNSGIFESIFFISPECGDFLRQLYGLRERLEYLPLGGYPVEPQEKMQVRRSVRKRLELSDDAVGSVHSGKMDPLKRTDELIRAFTAVADPRFRLLLAGSMPDSTRDTLQQLMQKDDRIRYLGWKSGSELRELLCACDLYAQPGSQSATLQNAMCCGCAVMIYPHRSHESFLGRNAFSVSTEQDMAQALRKISQNPEILRLMGEESMKIARELLDYRKQARLITQPPAVRRSFDENSDSDR